MTIKDLLQEATRHGYRDENAEAYVCQNLVLLAMSYSPLCKNVTVKGGVVMRCISNSARRATQDMDIDFIRYSLNDDAIAHFISKLNSIPTIRFEQIGKAEELKQQDYHGKRIYIRITDSDGFVLESKIDLGVHKDLSIEQEDYCFDISGFNSTVNLLINSKEQMFTEKLRSILKFGPNSTRYKDIFDLFFLSSLLDKDKLNKCINTLIFSNSGMREKTKDDIYNRVSYTFSDPRYRKRLAGCQKNWLDIPVDDVLEEILRFLISI